MLRLQPIVSFYDDRLNIIRDIYTESFPPEELRNFDEIIKLLKTNAYFKILAILINEKVSGFVNYWQFPHFYFVEHFAVDAKHRNGGYGTRAVNAFLEQAKRTTILEAEKAEHEMAKRRVAFYQRLGFSISPFPYAQMPYEKAFDPVPMHLMYRGSMELSNEPVFQSTKNLIYKTVYGVTE